MRLPAFITVVALTASLASPALAKHETSAKQDRELRALQILKKHAVKNRHTAWVWQDKAGWKRSPTRHHERITHSVKYLRWIVHLWHDRAYAAMREYHRKHSIPRSSSGSSSNGPFAIDSCTRALLAREGGMDPHASNTEGSGAYGGPQALPGSKMASAGSDWRDNIWTQIRWMIGYMNSSYGGSCNALAHSYAYGWY